MWKKSIIHAKAFSYLQKQSLNRKEYSNLELFNFSTEYNTEYKEKLNDHKLSTLAVKFNNTDNCVITSSNGVQKLSGWQLPCGRNIYNVSCFSYVLSLKKFQFDKEKVFFKELNKVIFKTTVSLIFLCRNA